MSLPQLSVHAYEPAGQVEFGAARVTASDPFENRLQVWLPQLSVQEYVPIGQVICAWAECGADSQNAATITSKPISFVIAASLLEGR